MVLFLAAAALGASYLFYRGTREREPAHRIGDCLACMEPVYVTARPRYYRQPQDLTMEERLYGLQLPCPGSHIFCTPCLRTYLLERLSQALRGDSIVVARCPACPGDSWRMHESCAARILLPEEMDDWRQQQYLDAVEKIYCPNPRCSEALQLEDGCRSTQNTACPLCRTPICVPCRSVAHKGMSCSKWQSSAKSMGGSDVALRKLAKKLQWRRCPRCRIVVERNEGCKHMTCRCGHQFCFLCGSTWLDQCTRGSKDCDSFEVDGTLRLPTKWALLRIGAANAFRNSAQKTKRAVSQLKSLGGSKSEVGT